MQPLFTMLYIITSTIITIIIIEYCPNAQVIG